MAREGPDRFNERSEARTFPASAARRLSRSPVICSPSTTPADTSPATSDAIVDGVSGNALDDPDPLRQHRPTGRPLAAAFVLNPDAVTPTKTLGTERTHEAPRWAAGPASTPTHTGVREVLPPSCRHA